LLTRGFILLLAIARQPGIRLEALSRIAGVSQRQAIRLINDLEDAGYVQRGGRPNLRDYRINPRARVREADRDISLHELLAPLL
jgi:DNA-binding IclR family transcriptional regulator